MRKNLYIDPRFNQLLEKFYEEECSLSELYELEAFFEKEQSAVALKKQMLQSLEENNFSTSGHFSSEATYQKVQRQIEIQQQASRGRLIPLYLRVLKIAAVVIFSFLIGGIVVSNFKGKGEPEPTFYCEISAPLGAKSEVILPDSSKVWLNAGSTLRYSTAFNKNERNVLLTGEGYFEVVKNKQLPFRVNAHGFIVEAIGTEFNVQAYEEEQTIETILVNGKVKLNHETEKIGEQVFLNPNSKATFYKSREDAIKNGDPRMVILINVDTRSLIGWKYDQLIFESESLKDLVVTLGRKYDYTFEFESSEVADYKFSGTLQDETLQQVMDVITITSPISYKIEGKTVTINKDLKRTRNFKKN
ncbi:FecR family protein [Sunxiuqinia rutila]|uniref:FecR family protein n=1 Tax=Sunxiuqinia rutila TaxID=1397841 RepID=UPI003D361D6A